MVSQMMHHIACTDDGREQVRGTGLNKISMHISMKSVLVTVQNR